MARANNSAITTASINTSSLPSSSSSAKPLHFSHRALAQAVPRPGASARPATADATAARTGHSDRERGTAIPPSPADTVTTLSPTTSRSRSRTGPLASPLTVSSPRSDNLDAARSRPQSSPSALKTFSPLQSPPSSASYFALRPKTSGSDIKSPFAKRPPASRSSHGIETATGPPPALSTQRTQSNDSWRWLPPNKDVAPASLKLTPRALARLNAANTATTTASASANTGGEEVDEQADAAESHANEKDGGLKVGGTLSRRSASALEMASGSTYGRSRYATGEDSLLGSSRRESKRLSAGYAGESYALKQSHEDLFLDLAKTDTSGGVGPGGESTTAEKRRSRIALPSHRQSLSQDAAGEHVQSSPMVEDRRASYQRAEISSQVRTPQSADRSASLKVRSYAASAHPLEQRYRNRMSSGAAKPLLAAPRFSGRESSPETPSVVGRRSSVPDPSGYPRSYRSSHLQHALNGGSASSYQSSPLAGRNVPVGLVDQSPSALKTEESASTVSTTAPSTVWDELDDLKSRIKKLELTGHLPASSGAAISSATERPRTATTTVTTISSSPKRAGRQSISPAGTSSIDPEEGALHPLLTSALGKARPRLNSDVYRALETTASDALTLAKMTNSSSSMHQQQHNATAGAVPSAIDRQLKRKADSLCRSLTELCIALSEAGLSDNSSSLVVPETPLSIVSRRGSTAGDQQLFERRGSSLEPEPSSARVLSRLEARRVSILGMNGLNGLLNSPNKGASLENGNSGNNSPATAAAAAVGGAVRDTHLDTTTPTQLSSTLSRTSTVLQRIRGRNNNNNQDNDDGDSTVRPRPLSRAMTEYGGGGSGRSPSASAGGVSSSASKRMSREYTSNHPLPSHTTGEYFPSQMTSPQGPSSQSSGLPVTRRSFLNGAGGGGSVVHRTSQREQQYQHESPQPAQQPQQQDQLQPSTPGTVIATDRDRERDRERERGQGQVVAERAYTAKRRVLERTQSEQQRSAEVRQQRLHTLGFSTKNTPSAAGSPAGSGV